VLNREPAMLADFSSCWYLQQTWMNYAKNRKHGLAKSKANYIGNPSESSSSGMLMQGANRKLEKVEVSN